jgi:uncharacterized protein YlzI (FlbEa/FlbD family)
MTAHRLLADRPPLKLLKASVVSSGAQSGEGAVPVIVVTKLDGRTAALNADRVERIERNETTSTSNVYFVDGGRLTVVEGYEQLIEEIDESKARVLARAFAIAGETARAVTDGPTLRVLQNEDDIK